MKHPAMFHLQFNVSTIFFSPGGGDWFLSTDWGLNDVVKLREFCHFDKIFDKFFNLSA